MNTKITKKKTATTTKDFDLGRLSFYRKKLQLKFTKSGKIRLL